MFFFLPGYEPKVYHGLLISANCFIAEEHKQRNQQSLTNKFTTILALLKNTRRLNLLFRTEGVSSYVVA